MAYWNYNSGAWSHPDHAALPLLTTKLRQYKASNNQITPAALGSRFRGGLLFSLLAVIALLALSVNGARAQVTTGTFQNIIVTGSAQLTGTAQVTNLDLTGLLDVQSNLSYFGALSGSLSNESAASFFYTDGTNGAGATFLNTLTRPAAAWLWERLNSAGTSSLLAMTLNASNQLVLTGTQSSSPGSIVIDPTAGAITIDGYPVLTTASDIYSSTSGEIGIGTTSPESLLTLYGGAVDITSNGNNYSEGVRIHPSTSNGYSSIELGAVSGATGTGIGQWTFVRYPSSYNYLFGLRYDTTDYLDLTSTGTVGVGGELSPASTMSIKGNASVGTAYSEIAAPANALIVQGNLGVGTTAPQVPFQVGTNTVLGANAPLALLSKAATGNNSLMFARYGQSSGIVGLDSSNIFNISTQGGEGGIDLRTGGNFYSGGLTAGTSRLRVLDNGDVGIGTTTPGSLLSFGPIISNDILRLYDGGGNNNYGFGINNNTLEMYAGTSNPANHISFGTYNGTTFTENVRFKNNGSVGIGTTTPQAMLEVNGTAKVDGSLTVGGTFTLTGTQGSVGISSAIGGQLAVNGQSVLTSGSVLSTSSAGNVGIGTASPAAKLDVEGTGGDVILNDGPVGIGANPGTQGTGVDNPAPLYISESSGAGIRLMTSSSNHSLLSSQEYVDFYGPNNGFEGSITGLNADFPTGQGVYQPNQMVLWSGQPGGILLFARNWPSNQTSGPIVFATGTAGTNLGVEVMRIAPNAHVGVGAETSPASLMSIKGNASVGSGYSETAAPANGMIVQGNVGIGTSSPQAALAVSGSSAQAALSVSGSSTFAGNVTIGGTDNELPNQILVGSNSILTEGLGDGRYVPSIDMIAGSTAAGPDVALVDGSASGPYTFAGVGSSASGTDTIALGEEATASNSYSTALGAYTVANGPQAVALGFNTIAESSQAMAIGPQSGAYTPDSMAVGIGASAIAPWSLAAGYCTTTSGTGSIALGPFSMASGAYATSAGAYTVAPTYGEFVVGSYNLTPPSQSGTTWVPSDFLFVVGNGTSSSNQSDAVEVLKNGNTTINGSIAVSGTGASTFNGSVAVSGTAASTFAGPVSVAPGGDIPMFAGY